MYYQQQERCTEGVLGGDVVLALVDQKGSDAIVRLPRRTYISRWVSCNEGTWQGPGRVRAHAVGHFDMHCSNRRETGKQRHCPELEGPDWGHGRRREHECGHGAAAQSGCRRGRHLIGWGGSSAMRGQLRVDEKVDEKRYRSMWPECRHAGGRGRRHWVDVIKSATAAAEGGEGGGGGDDDNNSSNAHGGREGGCNRVGGRAAVPWL
ncbi:hypothetical protein COCCADRAFT_30818 [Bipolaris zeicola 26-R-13]|uniref:Uncharacterized protein n=1 Tax=Cochliobolus carbonum (strain 26-R-13) TaxID=930089 RepID=W6Y9K6_COCC2|nr:uncharacterized protein COCCADRAFT_30818 [Bipolaris zeicola 26-R-13]EUC27781.1 hypothetical protein COCCADRAFT_30818 [Bipolaris zeicola 26-R-13]